MSPTLRSCYISLNNNAYVSYYNAGALSSAVSSEWAFSELSIVLTIGIINNTVYPIYSLHYLLHSNFTKNTGGSPLPAGDLSQRHRDKSFPWRTVYTGPIIFMVLRDGESETWAKEIKERQKISDGKRRKQK